MQETRDSGSVPESGGSSRVGNGTPLQYSWLEKPHGQKSLVGYVHGIAKSWTWLSIAHIHYIRVCVCGCVGVGVGVCGYATSMGASIETEICLPMQETQETRVQFLGRDGSLEKEMATYCSILAWEIPGTEDPGRLQSLGSQRVGHIWAGNAREDAIYININMYDTRRIRHT